MLIIPYDYLKAISNFIEKYLNVYIVLGKYDSDYWVLPPFQQIQENEEARNLTPPWLIYKTGNITF